MLVVDDEAIMREVLIDEVRSLGFLAIEASNLSEAKAAIARGGIDAVLTDYRLIGESGLDLVTWIAREHAGKPKSIVISGGFGLDAEKIRATAGVAGILDKPASSGALTEALFSALDA